MKKFEFSLSRMLDYKEQLLEREKNELGRLNFQRSSLVEKIENLRRDQQMICNERQEEALNGITVYELQGYDYRISNIREQVKALLGDLKRLEGEIQRQTDVVVKASQEVKGLQKLSEKQLEEYQREQQRLQREEIEEFVSMKLARTAQ